jgi:hypothetical protein
VIQLDAGHRGLRHQRGRQPAVVARGDREHVRPVRHELADPAEVAGGREPPCDHHLDRPGELFDLLQDVRAEQDRAAGVGHRVQQIHHVQPLARVHAVERLVQEQRRRVVHQRRGYPDPLPHALGERLDTAVLGVGHLDVVDGPAGRGRRIGQPVQLRARQHELPRGEEAVHVLLLGDQAQPAVDVRVPPARLAADRHRAARRRQQAGHHVQQRRLAGAVRPEQARDARPDRHRDVVDRDHVAVPARRPGQFDVAHAVTFRYLWTSRAALPTARSSAASP